MKKINNYWNLIKHDKSTRKSFIKHWLIPNIAFILIGICLGIPWTGIQLVKLFGLTLIGHLTIEVLFSKTVYTESAVEAKELYHSEKSFFFNNVNGDLDENFFTK